MAGSRIALAGDWFRAHPSFGVGAGTARGNIRWLAGLLSAGIGVPLQRQTIIMPAAAPDGYRRDLDHAALGLRYDQDPLAAWLASFDGPDAAAAFPALFDRLAAADLVVGFELPPVMRRALAKRGARYLSIHVHPLRFLPDLALGVHSNCPAVQSALAAIAIADDQIMPHVARLSARLSRLDPCQAALPEMCPVLFGQTPADASLIAAGRISTWADHRDRVAQLLDGYPHVGFVRHPHAAWPTATLEWLRDDLGKTVIAMAGNAYPIIMAGHALGPVISLSSSIGAEAAAFGHDSHFLLADPRRAFAVAGLDNAQQVMVGHPFLAPAFWRAVLDRDSPALVPQADPFPMGENFVRSTLEAWSYAAIAGSGPLPGCTKIVMPSQQGDAHACDQLVAALSGLPPEPLSARAAMVDAAAAHGVEIRCFPPALASGTSWRWDRATEVLNLPNTEGLGPTEADGAWLDGGRCLFRLPLQAGPDPGQHLAGQLRFSFFRGVIGEYPVLLLRANDRPVAAWLHRGSDDPYHALDFAFSVPAGDWCALSLEVSHANSPAALGMGEDQRQLGVIVHDLSITVATSDSTGAGDVLSLWGFGHTALQLPPFMNWQTHDRAE